MNIKQEVRRIRLTEPRATWRDQGSSEVAAGKLEVMEKFFTPLPHSSRDRTPKGRRNKEPSWEGIKDQYYKECMSSSSPSSSSSPWSSESNFGVKGRFSGYQPFAPHSRSCNDLSIARTGGSGEKRDYIVQQKDGARIRKTDRDITERLSPGISKSGSTLKTQSRHTRHVAANSKDRLDNKRMLKNGGRRAKSMEALAEKETRKEQGNGRKEEKQRFSRFLDEITIQVLSPSSLNSLGVKERHISHNNREQWKNSSTDSSGSRGKVTQHEIDVEQQELRRKGKGKSVSSTKTKMSTEPPVPRRNREMSTSPDSVSSSPWQRGEREDTNLSAGGHQPRRSGHRLSQEKGRKSGNITEILKEKKEVMISGGEVSKGKAQYSDKGQNSPEQNVENFTDTSGRKNGRFSGTRSTTQIQETDHQSSTENLDQDKDFLNQKITELLDHLVRAQSTICALEKLNFYVINSDERTPVLSSEFGVQVSAKSRNGFVTPPIPDHMVLTSSKVLYLVQQHILEPDSSHTASHDHDIMKGPLAHLSLPSSVEVSSLIRHLPPDMVESVKDPHQGPNSGIQTEGPQGFKSSSTVSLQTSCADICSDDLKCNREEGKEEGDPAPRLTAFTPWSPRRQRSFTALHTLYTSTESECSLEDTLPTCKLLSPRFPNLGESFSDDRKDDGDLDDCETKSEQKISGVLKSSPPLPNLLPTHRIPQENHHVRASSSESSGEDTLINWVEMNSPALDYMSAQKILDTLLGLNAPSDRFAMPKPQTLDDFSSQIEGLAIRSKILFTNNSKGNPPKNDSKSIPYAASNHDDLHKYTERCPQPDTFVCSYYNPLHSPNDDYNQRMQSTEFRTPPLPAKRSSFSGNSADSSILNPVGEVGFRPLGKNESIAHHKSEPPSSLSIPDLTADSTSQCIPFVLRSPSGSESIMGTWEDKRYGQESRRDRRARKERTVTFHSTVNDGQPKHSQVTTGSKFMPNRYGEQGHEYNSSLDSTLL